VVLGPCDRVTLATVKPGLALLTGCVCTWVSPYLLGLVRSDLTNLSQQ
jgi:hypothetical protein